ncbi:uncharacterized protein LOC134837862 [Culicoides brevitarsis]|uniref:uncharacterized protein LOC134837862 n=1 Tax=Culicoides brevitarsis TaxID=469753 RepID=UPI00307C0E7A
MKSSQDTKLKYPEINRSSKKNRHPKSVHLQKEDLHHQLEDYVRLQYLKYVEGVLRDNYNLWLKSDTGQISGLIVTEKEIKETAETIEIEALKACTIVSLYRKQINKLIDTIKNETQQNLLNAVLMKTKFNSKPSKKHVATQTSVVHHQKRIPSPIVVDAKKHKKSTRNEIDVSEATLDEKIRRFQESFIETDDMKCPKNDCLDPLPVIETPTRPPMTPSINLNDLLSHRKQQKQVFFAPATPSSVASQTPSINYLQIPATPTCLMTPASTCTSNSVNQDAQDEVEKKIMQELNEMFGEEETKNDVEDIFGAESSKNVVKVTREPSPVIDLQTLSKMKDPEQEEKEMKQRLMSSIWPCELHHQKMRLRTVLSDIAERNFRKYEKIKQRFRELFDDDETENELAPYSPSIELDEILLGSCRKRISHWVVKTLMMPYKNGQIEKFLFKRLAKYLADSIIYQDQYPSETYVKDFVYDFICRHPRIECLEDMYSENYLN